MFILTTSGASILPQLWCWISENALELVSVAVALLAAVVAYLGNRKIRQLHRNLNRINILEAHQSTLLQLRSRLRSRLLVIRSVANQGGVQPEAEDLIPQTRRVSRSFREALRCYGDSYQLFEGVLKRDLDSAQVETIQTAMEKAARAFSENFQAEALHNIVDLHSKALDCMTTAVDSRIRQLKDEMGDRRSGTPSEQPEP